MEIPPIIQVGDVLLSGDIIERRFCCDLAVCRGVCCIEGDAGAPVTLDEIDDIEQRLDQIRPLMTSAAQRIVDREGVAYPDQEGELVTTIVHGRDCAFACRAKDIEGLPDGCCICALENIARQRGRTGDDDFVKPISCALYPIREKTIAGTICLNYHRWSICRPAEQLGERLDIPLYRFLRAPLIRRFGAEWYAELEAVVATLHSSTM